MSESKRDENGKFLPGTPKLPGSGRQKGTTNRRIATMMEVLTKENYNPLLELIRLAKDEKTSLEIKVQIDSTLIQYVYPKKRSIQVESEDGTLGAFVINAGGGKTEDAEAWAQEAAEEASRLAEEQQDH